MKMRTICWLALASSVAGCGKGGDAAAPTSPPPGGDNHNPTVNLNIDPTHLAYGQTATLSVSASDPDGNQVTFTWSAVLGTVSTSGPTATSASFTAGNHWGQASVTLTASDAKGGTTQATALTYIRNPNPPDFALAPVASTVSGCTGFALQFTPGEDVPVSALYIQPRLQALGHDLPGRRLRRGAGRSLHRVVLHPRHRCRLVATEEEVRRGASTRNMRVRITRFYMAVYISDANPDTSPRFGGSTQPCQRGIIGCRHRGRRPPGGLAPAGRLADRCGGPHAKPIACLLGGDPAYSGCPVRTCGKRTTTSVLA